MWKSAKNLGSLVNVVVIFLTLLCTLIITSSATSISVKRGIFVSGIHKEFLPKPIFYNSFVPIILEYSMPKWNKSDLTLMNEKPCETEKTPDDTQCQVFFHMQKVVENLHDDFQGIRSVADKDNGKTSQIHLERLVSSIEFCEKIQKHFHGISTKTTEVEKYILALRNCQWDSGLEPLVERSIETYNFNIGKPFTLMQNNFFNLFYETINSGEKMPNMTNKTDKVTFPVPDLNYAHTVAYAVMINNKIAFQGALLAVYNAENNRWVHANQDCFNQIIPQSIVTRDKFYGALEKLSNLTLFKTNENELSIDLSSISKYYSLPLTDCSNTNNDSLIVRILVPISKKNITQRLELVNVQNLPFQYKDHLCQLKLTSQDFYRNNFENSYYLFDNSTGSAFPTDCKPNELCKIDTHSLSFRNRDKCVSALLSNDRWNNINSHCDFHCYKNDDTDNQLIVTRTGLNKYIVTTGNPLNGTVNCKDQSQSQIFYLKSEDIVVGSYEIDLPCNCKMTLAEQIHYAEGPCNNDSKEVNVIQIVPVHFRTFEQVKPNRTLLTEPEDKPFQSESMITDLLDLDRINGYLNLKAASPELDDTVDNSSNIIKDIIHSLSRNVSIEKEEQEDSRSNNSMGIEKLTSDTPNVQSLNLIWGVVIATLFITLIVFSIQIYILCSWKKHQTSDGSISDRKITYSNSDNRANSESLIQGIPMESSEFNKPRFFSTFQ